MKLHHLVAKAAQRRPDALAVSVGNESLNYGELDAVASRLARALADVGVRPGDRVGIWTEKSPAVVAAMQAVLRARGAYVPVDAMSPVARAETIFRDCAVAAVVTTADRAVGLSSELRERTPIVLVSGEMPGAIRWDDLSTYAEAPLDLPEPGDDDLAYILYTSGSTGKPKGVCISHRNAMSFIEWAAREIDACDSDRFSNHAPFHFDLSVLDIYVPFWAGGSVHIIREQAAYVPSALVDFVREVQPTVWYSVPTALSLMMQHGLADVEPLPMRAVLFAGEPFPIEQLKRLRSRWPTLQLLNLYGPTETNVCTFYEVPASLEGFSRPVPIGEACSGDTAWAIKEDGTTAGAGEQGELMVSGPTVMLGYWGAEPQGAQPYPTGDIVQVVGDGVYEYVGRRDQMLKVRGHRVEPGEIEAVLGQHEAVEEACVVACGRPDAELVAWLVGHGRDRPGLLSIKQHCAKQLPRYMIVDKVRFLDALPRTRNGKVDRRKLEEMAAEIV